MSQRPLGSFTQATAPAFADLIIDGHRETRPLRSKRFGAWLRQQYYERTWDAPSPAALNAALNALEGRPSSMVPSARSRSASPIMGPEPPEQVNRLAQFPWERTPVQERDEFDAMREAVSDLERLVRYERRAWSHQRRAMREFMAIKASSLDDNRNASH